MSLGPFLKSKRSILLWIAVFGAIFSVYCFQKYSDLDAHYSVLPQEGKTPSYVANTVNWLTARQHPGGYFVNNPDLFSEPSILNRESIRLSRYAVLTLNQLNSLHRIDQEKLVAFVLNNYKSPSNAIGNLKGFSVLPNSTVNLRATMDSVIILSKLGALDRIDKDAVVQLILAYQNADGGFWDPNYPEFGQQSTVQATSFAIRTLRHLDKLNNEAIDIERQKRINQFIQNAWSKDTKAFSPFPEHPAISSYDAFRAWISVYYLPINQNEPPKIANLLHLEELTETLNTTFLTSEGVYSEGGNSERSSLKASHLITWMMAKMEKVERLPSWDIIQFVRSYQDPRGGFASDIYSVYSAVDTLELLASTRMSGQLLIYQLLTYAAILVTLLCLLTLLFFQRKVQSRRRSVLVHKAQTDRLTGLHNREFLEKRYKNYQTDNSHIALILLDVDHFKSINDNHGHLVGDEVLVELSKLLSDNIRKTDTLARWGGEEFAILCPATEPGHSKIFSEKLRCLIEQHPFDDVSNITCSIGVSCSTQDESLKDLFSRADKALYQSKGNGRNQVTYC